MLIFLSGCWDTNEPERLVYAQGMGIDYKNGSYTVYIQIMSLSLLAKSEASGGGDQVKLEVGHGTGKTIDDAVFDLYHSSQRKVFFGHLAFVILTDRALRHGAIKSVVDLLDRYRETRYQIYVYGTKEPLNKILLATPLFEMANALSRLSDPKQTYKQSSYIKPEDMRELIISLNEPGHEAGIPLISLKKWATDIKTQPTLTSKGISIVTSTALKGNLTGKKVSGFRWVQNEFVRDILTVNKRDRPPIDLVITKKKVKIVPHVLNGRLTFQINIKTKAYIDDVREYTKLSTIEKAVERQIKKEVLLSFNKGLDIHSDIYHLSHVLYKKNNTAWKQVQKQGRIPLDKNSIVVNVEVKVVHGGKQRLAPTLN